MKKRSLPITIIQDGFLFREDLTRAGKDMVWLRETLGKRKTRQELTLLLTIDEEENLLWIGKDQ